MGNAISSLRQVGPQWMSALHSERAERPRQTSRGGRPRPTNNQTLVVAAAVAATGWVAWFIYAWTRPTLADDAAGAARSALVRRDPEALYGYILDFQREQLNLSKEKFAQMWHSLVEPRLSKFKVIAIGEPSVNFGKSQGEIEWQIQDPDGNTFSWSTVVWNTDGGGRLDAFDSLLLAWWLEYAISEGKPQTDSAAFREAILEGLRRDRAKLESYGITVRPSQYPWMPPLTLDEWERQLRQRAQSGARKPSGA